MRQSTCLRLNLTIAHCCTRQPGSIQKLWNCHHFIYIDCHNMEAALFPCSNRHAYDISNLHKNAGLMNPDTARGSHFRNLEAAYYPGRFRCTFFGRPTHSGLPTPTPLRNGPSFFSHTRGVLLKNAPLLHTTPHHTMPHQDTNKHTREHTHAYTCAADNPTHVTS